MLHEDRGVYLDRLEGPLYTQNTGIRDLIMVASHTREEKIAYFKGDDGTAGQPVEEKS